MANPPGDRCGCAGRARGGAVTRPQNAYTQEMDRLFAAQKARQRASSVEVDVLIERIENGSVSREDAKVEADALARRMLADVRAFIDAAKTLDAAK